MGEIHAYRGRKAHLGFSTHAVIAALEFQDLVTASIGARKADGVHVCLTAGCDEAYEDDPKAIAPRRKYKQLFGRSELKLTIINILREAPANDETIAARIMDAKGWGEDMYPDVLERVRDAIQRAQKDGHVVQDFGPDRCLWRIKR